MFSNSKYQDCDCQVWANRIGTCKSTSAEVHLLPCIEDPTSMTCTLEVGARDVMQKDLHLGDPISEKFSLISLESLQWRDS